MNLVDLRVDVVADLLDADTPAGYFCTREYTFFVDRVGLTARPGRYHSDPFCGRRWRRLRPVRGVSVVTLPASAWCHCLRVPAEVFTRPWVKSLFPTCHAIHTARAAADALDAAVTGPIRHREDRVAGSVAALGMAGHQLAAVAQHPQVVVAAAQVRSALAGAHAWYPRLVATAATRYGSGPAALVGFEPGTTPAVPVLAAVAILARGGVSQRRAVVRLPGPVAVVLAETPGVHVLPVEALPARGRSRVDDAVVEIASTLWGSTGALGDLGVVVEVALALAR